MTLHDIYENKTASGGLVPSGRTVGTKGTFANDVNLLSLYIKSPFAGTMTVRVAIYNATTQALVVNGDYITLTMDAGATYEVPVGVTALLTANTEYMVGFYCSTANNTNFGYSTTLTPINTPINSSPAGTSFSKTYVGYYSLFGEAFPSGGNASREWVLGFKVSVNNLPAAPTSVQAIPQTAPVAALTWAHSDVDGDQASKYQFRRRLSSSGTWTELTEVLSQGADTGPNILAAHGDFEAANAIALGGWESNPAFGSFPQSTIARTTAKPDTGSYSLEVTLPTLASNQNTIANCTAHGRLFPGRTYRASARVWMQAGGPNVVFDMLYQAGQTAEVNTVKGAWTTVSSVFVFTGSNAFPGVKTVGAATSGMKMYVDNVKIHEVASQSAATITFPNSESYYIGVRTSDAFGYSPWSSDVLVTFGTIVKIKVAGAWVTAVRKVKVGGAWVSSTLKTKNNGSW